MVVKPMVQAVVSGLVGGIREYGASFPQMGQRATKIGWPILTDSCEGTGIREPQKKHDTSFVLLSESTFALTQLLLATAFPGAVCIPTRDAILESAM